MSEPTIGLYVTYYNERELLADLIRSIISEANCPEEIIVYDDCSSSPASEFLPRNAPIKVIRGLERRGPAFGRNRLLESAKMDYVHFHDSDDFFLPGWSKRLREIIKDCAPELVFTEAATYKDEVLQVSDRIGLEKLRIEQDLLGFCIDHAIHPTAGTYSRKLLTSMGGYPEELWQAEDYAFHIRLATRCARYAVITEPLVGVRLRSASRSSNKVEVYRDALNGLKLVVSEIPESYQTQLADAALSISRLLYKLGDKKGARAGFSLAVCLGRPSYRKLRWKYRLCARVVGPFYTEMVNAVYDKIRMASQEVVLAERRLRR